MFDPQGGTKWGFSEVIRISAGGYHPKAKIPGHNCCEDYCCSNHLVMGIERETGCIGALFSLENGVDAVRNLEH